MTKWSPRGRYVLRLVLLRFVRGAILCRGLVGRRGGPIVIFTLLSIFFWLASLATVIQTYYRSIHTSKFNVQYSLIQIMKRIQLPIPCFYQRALSYISCLESHDFATIKLTIFWGEDPQTRHPPSQTHLQYQKQPCHLCVCAIVQKTIPYRKKTWMQIIVYNFVYKRTDALSLWHQQ